jgi:hypothetical protein
MTIVEALAFAHPLAHRIQTFSKLIFERDCPRRNASMADLIGLAAGGVEWQNGRFRGN